MPDTERRDFRDGFHDRRVALETLVGARLEESHGRLESLEARVSRLEGVGATTSNEPLSATDHAARLFAASDAVRFRISVGDAGVAAAEQIHDALDVARTEWFDEITAMFPALDPATVAELAADDPARQGALMLYRGFRGEQLVDDLLRAGTLPLPEGTTGHTMADTTNQPGWDLLITHNGSTTAANVKITDDGDLIRHHFRANPDVPVVFASSDASDSMVGSDVGGRAVTVLRPGDSWPDQLEGFTVVDIGHDSVALTNEVTDALAGAGTDSLADEIVDHLPLVALALIAARGTWRLASTDGDAAEIGRRSLSEVRNLLVNAGVGEAVGMLTGLSLLASPVTIATAVARSTSGALKADIGRSTARSERTASFLGTLRND